MHLTLRLRFWVGQPLNGNNVCKAVPRFTCPGTSKPGRFTYFALDVRNASRFTSSPGPVNRDGLPTLPLMYVMRPALPPPGASKPGRSTYFKFGNKMRDEPLPFLIRQLS
jgi:hypothetical protein